MKLGYRNIARYLGAAVFAFSVICPLFAQNSFSVYFNEIRANDAGNDDAEFVELIAPAGTNLSGFAIVHYDGQENKDDEVIRHTIGSFTVPDDGITAANGTHLGFYVVGFGGFSSSGVTDATVGSRGTLNLLDGPNGAGLILYDPSGNILDAVAWGTGGDMTTNDPGTVVTTGPASANNYLAVTPSDENNDNSLQAPSLLFDDTGSGWGYTTATAGSINSGQTTGDITLPVELSLFQAEGRNREVILNWATSSEVENLGFEIERAMALEGPYELISSYISNPDLEGQINSSQETSYRYIDRSVANGTTYWYQLVDVSLSGIRTAHGPIEAMPLEVSAVAADFQLRPNYPNPFNPSTTLAFNVAGEIGQSYAVRLEIYNPLGQKVKTVVQDNLPAGNYEYTWNGDSDSGSLLPAGIYFASLRSGTANKVIKMVMIK
ncbi:MAG: T9SS type A sorting domain-containing protein [Calditrichaeota bacterium]|nr:T9SS type A sorting domain-containing protein [Calditrichota bacterium]